MRILHVWNLSSWDHKVYRRGEHYHRSQLHNNNNNNNNRIWRKRRSRRAANVAISLVPLLHRFISFCRSFVKLLQRHYTVYDSSRTPWRRKCTPVWCLKAAASNSRCFPHMLKIYRTGKQCLILPSFSQESLPFLSFFLSWSLLWSMYDMKKNKSSGRIESLLPWIVLEEIITSESGDAQCCVGTGMKKDYSMQ